MILTMLKRILFTSLVLPMALAEAQPGLGVSHPGLSPCELEVPAAAFPCGIVLLAGPGIDVEALTALARSKGASVSFRYPAVGAVAVVVPPGLALRQLKQGDITLIPDRVVRAIAKGGKGKGGNKPTGQVVPAGVVRIGAAPGVLPMTGSGIGVAIVDTGIDLGQVDLDVAGQCFDAFGGNCQDDEGHGTHVAGVVAALDNEGDVVGVAPGAVPYAVKVLDASGRGNDSTIMAGLQWISDNADAVTPPIRAVNMSLGRPGSVNDNPALHALVQAVTGKGIAVIVAAGNDPNSVISQQVPASYPEVMATASTTAVDGGNQCRFFSGTIAADTASFFTTDGTGVAISAPGADQEDITRGCAIRSQGILSLQLGGGTTRMSGTSMASPHVAGVVALMLQQAGGELAPEVTRALLRSAAAGAGVAPLDSPTTSYSFDGEREGVVSACAVLGANCP